MLHTANDDLRDGAGVGVAAAGDALVSPRVLHFDLVEYQS